MTAHVKVGGEWKEIDPQVKVNGVWKEVDSGWVKVGGTWREFYSAGFSGIVNWLMAADAGKLYASEDGTTFKKVKSTPFGTSNVNDVIYADDLSSPGNQVFLAAGDSGKLAKSSDGLTWSTVNTGDTTDINVIAYGGESGIPNGSTWTTVTSNFGNTIILSIAYGNGLWVAGGSSGQIRTSTDGSTWTTVNSNFGNTIILSIAYGNGLWVAGGYTGQIRTSTNGSTWTTVTSNFGASNINSIAYGNGLWIAGGVTGQIRTSTNGSTWTTVTSNFGNTSILSIAYGNGLWVAGADTGQIRGSTNLAEQLNLNKFIKSQDEQKAAFLNNNGILFNWNGIAYEKISTGINDNFVNGAIRNNGGTYEYIIQGNNALYRSTNLTTWTTITAPAASNINDIIAKP